MADIQAEFEIVEPEFAQPSFMVVEMHKRVDLRIPPDTRLS